jgi:hypothetical protein
MVEQRPIPDAIIGTPRTRQTTFARARDILAMTRMGLSKDDIAEREQITPERVRQLLKLATSEPPSSEPGESRPADTTIPSPATRPKPKMTERTLTHRAVLAMRTDYRLLSCPPAEQLLWLKSVQVIHTLGDGHGLGFGQRGDGFKSRTAFAAALGGTDADLNALLDRGLLVDLDEDGIDLPSNIGLKPSPKAGRQPQRLPDPALPSVHARPHAPVPGQRSMLLGIAGGTKDVADPNFGPNFAASRSKGFGAGPNFPAEILVSGQIFAKDLEPGAVTGTTTTTTQIIDSIGSSGREAPASPQNLEPPKDLANTQNLENPTAAAAPPSTPVWVSVAAELAGIAGLPRAPTSAEALAVRAWLDAGASPETLRGVVRSVTLRENCPSQPALSYFDGPIRDALKGADRQRTTPAPLRPESAAPPVSPETQSALDRLNALWRQYANNRSGPMPPANPRFATAMSDPAAMTWLLVMEGYYKRNRLGDHPPEFDAWMAGAWKNPGADDPAEIVPGPPPNAPG